MEEEIHNMAEDLTNTNTFVCTECRFSFEITMKFPVNPNRLVYNGVSMFTVDFHVL